MRPHNVDLGSVVVDCDANGARVFASCIVDDKRWATLWRVRRARIQTPGPLIGAQPLLCGGRFFSDAHRTQVRQGLKMANQEVAPELLLLPVAAPEAAR